MTVFCCKLCHELSDRCLCGRVIGGQAFTTGKITRSSIEKVLPNTLVGFQLKDGAGCNASHYLPAELEGKIVPDEHIHEHATCFNLKDKLVNATKNEFLSSPSPSDQMACAFLAPNVR
jgi:hypothetical protein